MKLSNNKLNTAHGIMYLIVGISYPILFFIILFNEKRMFLGESKWLIPTAFSYVILWNVIVMFVSKLNKELERNIKIMDYYALSGVRKLGQKIDWEEAIKKYENGEMNNFFRKYWLIKVFACIILWLVFFVP